MDVFERQNGGEIEDERNGATSEAEPLVVDRTISPGDKVSPTWLVWLPRLLVAGIVLWGAWFERASMANVAYFNDGVLHEQMVRSATAALKSGHLPFTQWYPLLNLGSPLFIHYQGLGATLVGLWGLLLGPNVAFRLSLYLLFALWPIAIYVAGRVWGFSRWVAAVAAAVSPLLMSYVNIGYEGKAYEWWGYGVWAQLIASWALPFAWAYTWRALREGRDFWKAGLCIALTCSLHFETGYSAFIALLIFPLVAGVPVVESLRRMMRIGAVALASVSWVLVPLLLSSKWSAINVQQVHSNWARGYGARQDLAWLIRGMYFDFGRPPVLTVMVAIGMLIGLWSWRRQPLMRSVIVLFVFVFMLSWGPTTWHGLLNVIPGHTDIFFRRFQSAVDLAAIYLIGAGTVATAGLIASFSRYRAMRWFAGARVKLATYGIAALVVVGIALPGSIAFQSRNSRNVALQAQDQVADTSLINPIISYITRNGGGRVYAGAPWNWGRKFYFGVGPMYMYLADRDIPQVSTTGWAPSPMEEPQADFNESNLSDYEIFGVRYILLPSSRKPSVPATLVVSSGPYRLWVLPHVGYFSVVNIEGYVDANKWTIGPQSMYALQTKYFAEHIALALNYGSATDAVKLPSHQPDHTPGVITNRVVDLAAGQASATVRMSEPGSVVLSASIDPGWQVFVDGAPAPLQNVAPGLVSVALGAGIHHVEFRFQGFRWYLPLWLLGGLVTYLVWYEERRTLPILRFTPWRRKTPRS